MLSYNDSTSAQSVRLDATLDPLLFLADLAMTTKRAIMDRVELSMWFFFLYNPSGGENRDDPVILPSGRESSNEKERR
jgi:hypothetical protein